MKSQLVPPRVFLVDDHPMFLDAIVGQVQNDSRLLYSGAATSGLAAMEGIAELRPDLVVVDLVMPDISGVRLTEWLRESDQASAVIWMSHCLGSDYIPLAKALGVRGFLSKSLPGIDFLEGIVQIGNGGELWHCGEGNLDRDIQFHLNQYKETIALTKRQCDILRGIADGKPNKVIAAELDISQRTVETLRARLYRKLHLHTPADLIKYAVERAFV